MARPIEFQRWCNRRHQWLFLLAFDLDDVDEIDLEVTAEKLLRMSSHKNMTARMIAPGEQLGLLYWNELEGWHEPKEIPA